MSKWVIVCGSNNMGWQWVPINDCSWEKWRLEGIMLTLILYKTVTMGLSGLACDRLQIGARIYWHYVVYNFVHHTKPHVSPPESQRSPLELIQHTGYTRSVMVPVESPACCASLHHLNFVGTSHSVRIPYTGTVLQLRSDKGFVSMLFYTRGHGSEVSTKESQGSCCFRYNFRYMVIPCQIVWDGNP